MKTTIILTLCFVVLILGIHYSDYKFETMVKETNRIADSLQKDGWSVEASYIIAGFETDLYDESDSLEYSLYKAYMED